MTVPEGTRVRLAFESGLPTGCFALSAVDQDAGAELAFALLDDQSDCGTLQGQADLGTGKVTFVYTGPFSSGTGLTVALNGKIIGPGHKYAKGRPA